MRDRADGAGPRLERARVHFLELLLDRVELELVDVACNGNVVDATMESIV